MANLTREGPDHAAGQNAAGHVDCSITDNGNDRGGRFRDFGSGCVHNFEYCTVAVTTSQSATTAAAAPATTTGPAAIATPTQTKRAPGSSAADTAELNNATCRSFINMSDSSEMEAAAQIRDSFPYAVGNPKYAGPPPDSQACYMVSSLTTLCSQPGKSNVRMADQTPKGSAGNREFAGACGLGDRGDALSGGVRCPCLAVSLS